MKDEMRTKKALVEELSNLRSEIARLKSLDSGRKQTEELLWDSEERYRLLFESTSDVVYAIDTDFRILNVSPSVEKFLGYQCGEIVGKYAYDIKFLPPESLERGLADILRILKGETVTVDDYVFIAKDGTRKIWEISGAPLIRDGKIVGVISVARDRTECKRAEEAAQKAMSLLTSTIESTADGILVVDNEGRITTFNKKFLSLWRIPESFTEQRDEGDARHFEQIGFAAYMTKPIRHQELKAVLSVALTERNGAEPGPGTIVTRHTAREKRILFTGRKTRILLAEDNITNQQVAIGILKMMGLHANAVANGAEAVKALETLPYDLVLMDVQMPEMDGFEATRVIRNPQSPSSHHCHDCPRLAGRPGALPGGGHE